MQYLSKAQDLGYLLGGLIFGIALYRAHVLARWASALLAVGGVITIALSVMPDAFYRLLALPNGIAMIGLGYSLWSTARPSQEPGSARQQSARRDGACGMNQSTALGTRSAPARRPGFRGESSWRVPAALVALTAIPLAAGSLRLLEIAGGPQLLPTNPGSRPPPAPLILHVVAAVVFAVIGAFQFPARLRRRHRTWHRRAGRVLVTAGLAVAGSGLWMTLSYPDAPGGALLWTVRLVVGSAMATCIVLGFTAIRRRDVAAHKAWMIRAYALAIKGTQAFTQGVGEGVFEAGGLSTALSVTSGWVINLAVAEWMIRRPESHRARRARASRGGREPTMNSPGHGAPPSLRIQDTSTSTGRHRSAASPSPTTTTARPPSAAS